MKQALKDISSEKPQLVKTAHRLGSIDRVALDGDDVREFRGVDGRVVKSVVDSSDFRSVWNDIVSVMSVIAPVEMREGTEDGDVCFTALAAGSRRDLKVVYHADGTLDVKALWAASASVSRAMVVVDETYSL